MQVTKKMSLIAMLSLRAASGGLLLAPINEKGNMVRSSGLRECGLRWWEDRYFRLVALVHFNI
jgi:hypothetical protein